MFPSFIWLELELKLNIRLSLHLLCYLFSAVYSADYGAVADISRPHAASSRCDDKLQRNPSHSWKLRGPGLQRRAPGPSTRTTPMYSFVCLLLSLPFPPSSPPFPLPSPSASVFFPLLHFDTPSLSKSLTVHLKSGLCLFNAFFIPYSNIN